MQEIKDDIEHINQQLFNKKIACELKYCKEGEKVK